MGLSWSSLIETALDQLREARKPQVEPQRFLAQLEIVATLLRVDLTDRSYRNNFTPNYRVLFDRRRLYIYELFNCFDCEPIFARQKGKLLKRCYHDLLETVDAYFLVGAIPDLEKMRTLLARFDKTWELFKIEAEARAPVVRAMQLEHKLRSLEASDTPQLEVLVSSIRDRPPTRYNERFEVLKQLVQLTAGLNNCANVAGRGRYDLSMDVLVAAADRWALAKSLKPSNELETYHCKVQRVLSSRVLQHFADLRKYFGSISDIWKEVDPQLCNNRKLVDALAAWEVAWELGNRSLLKQDVLQSFSSCAAMTLDAGHAYGRDAQRLAPSLPRLIDTRDAELFLILPRLVLLNALRAPSQSGLLRELLPHQFAECAEAEAKEEHGKAKEGRAEGTEAEFPSRLSELKQDFQEVQKSLVRASASDRDFLTRRVISGPSAESEGDEKLHNFLLALEGLSVELQRYRPTDWNQTCSALLECIEAASGREVGNAPALRLPSDLTEDAQENQPDFEPSASLRRAMRPWCLGHFLVTFQGCFGVKDGRYKIVMVINVVLQLVLVYLAEFERPLSHTSLNSSMMKKAFWAQTLNTGFVLFFVNYFAPEVLQNAVLIIPGVGNLLFRGPFAEITRGWYAIVGVTILMNMLLNCFVPAGVTVAKMIVNVFMRCFFRMGVAHQAELLELYTHPEFDIKQKYAQLLTTVFVTLMYGAGLPLLYFLACAFMFCQYWADKYCLLWGSRRPPHYDTKMATEAIESMLYAVPFHCVLAILMYGQTCVFPSNPLGGDLGNLVDEGSGYTPGMLQQFIPQITRESTWMFFLLFVLLVVLWVLWLVLWIIGGTASTAWDLIVDVCCPKWKRKQPSRDEMVAALKKGERTLNGYSIDVASTMNWDEAFFHIESSFPPASYRFERHPALVSVAPLLRPASQPNTARGSPSDAAEAALRTAAEVSQENEAEATRAPTSAPVPDNVAKNFLKALDEEYVQSKGAKVGDFFDSEGYQDPLSPFEEKVRGAENKKEAIEAIAKEWGVECP
eukprot:s2197_g3.t1